MSSRFNINRVIKRVKTGAQETFYLASKRYREAANKTTFPWMCERYHCEVLADLLADQAYDHF